MNFKELKKKTESELRRDLSDSQQNIRRLRFELASGKVKNLKAMREAKKSIAQILTLFSERKYKAQ